MMGMQVAAPQLVDVEATPARVSVGATRSLTEWRTAAQIERREDHV